jgi:hypothetical protein
VVYVLIVLSMLWIVAMVAFAVYILVTTRH